MFKKVKSWFHISKLSFFYWIHTHFQGKSLSYERLFPVFVFLFSFTFYFRLYRVLRPLHSCKSKPPSSIRFRIRLAVDWLMPSSFSTVLRVTYPFTLIKSSIASSSLRIDSDTTLLNFDEAFRFGNVILKALLLTSISGFLVIIVPFLVFLVNAAHEMIRKQFLMPKIAQNFR